MLSCRNSRALVPTHQNAGSTPAPTDFGVAAWKLQRRQRRQLAGTTYHHMRHWNKSTAAAPTAGHYGEGRHGGQHTGGSGGGGGSSDSDSDTPRPRHTHLRGVAGRHGHRPSHGHLLSTSLITDSQVYARLKNVVVALEALSLQVGGACCGSAQGAETRCDCSEARDHASAMAGAWKCN